jgi:hypothetical protein
MVKIDCLCENRCFYSGVFQVWGYIAEDTSLTDGTSERFYKCDCECHKEETS